MFTLMLILGTVLQAPDAKPQPPAERGAPKAKPGRKPKSAIANATPEQALRTFMIAMVAKDEATLRAVTLPNDDLPWLFRGQAPPAGQLANVKNQFAKMPIRVLKPGDEITLPGNRKVTVQPQEVTADRAVLLPQGAPVPTRCRKVDGLWRVDAAPIIAGRKAAEAARQKAARRGG
jgi:hypothetical protein